MKIEIYKDAQSLKRILCYSSSPQAIAVTEEMVDYLFQESNKIILLSAIGHNLSEIINSLTIADTTKGYNQKIIILVRTPEHIPMVMSDIAQIATLLEHFPKEADICWGLATAKETDNIVLLIAIASNEES